MDKVGYKYRTDSDYTEEILKSGKVFLATAHQLNDPFECSLRDISKDWLEEQIRTSMQAALTGFIMSAHQAVQGGGSFMGLRPSDVQETLASISAAVDVEASYDAMRAFFKRHTGRPTSDCRTMYSKIDEQLVETGIFSMSSDPCQPLMWAHYSGEHRGLCFGFRSVVGSKLADPDHCLPVTYSDELPVMDGPGLQTSLKMAMDEAGRPYTSSLKVAFTDKTFQRIVTTKPTAWSYEQEIRYIEPFSGLCDWPGEFAECTFGLRCPDGRRRSYIDLLEEYVPNDVLLFEIRAKPGKNALERVPLNPPLARTRRRAPSQPETLEESVPQSHDTFMARMQQLIQQERYGEVIFQTAENLKRNPSDPQLMHIKATAHGLAQEHMLAYELYQKLTESYPDVAAGWYGMACALQLMGRLEQVVTLFECAYRLNPNDPSIALNLGLHLVQDSKRREEGLACLRRAERLGHRRARRIIDDVESGSRPLD
jgi:hypothetical protein